MKNLDIIKIISFKVAMLSIILQCTAKLEIVASKFKRISRNCLLSPLMGAIVLKSRGSAMTKLKNIVYARYM